MSISDITLQTRFVAFFIHHEKMVLIDEDIYHSTWIFPELKEQLFGRILCLYIEKGGQETVIFPSIKRDMTQNAGNLFIIGKYGK